MFRAFLALAFAGALSVAVVARAAPPSIDAYGKLPAVEHVALSPSGQLYALIMVNGDAVAAK